MSGAPSLDCWACVNFDGSCRWLVSSAILTFVGLYAGATFSSCVLVTGGASAPHPSLSVCSCGWATRDRDPRGLNGEPLPAMAVGVNTGFDEAGGLGPLADGIFPPPEYFEPEASATFCMIESGVRSRSDRAVI